MGNSQDSRSVLKNTDVNVFVSRSAGITDSSIIRSSSPVMISSFLNHKMVHRGNKKFAIFTIRIKCVFLPGTWDWDLHLVSSVSFSIKMGGTEITESVKGDVEKKLITKNI